MSVAGENIKKFRKRAGYTIRQLGELSGVSKSVISELENGKSNNSRHDTINKLAAALNVAPELIDEMEYEHEYIITDVREAFELIMSQENLTINGEVLTKEAKSQLVNSVKMALKFTEEIQKNSHEKRESN